MKARNITLGLTALICIISINVIAFIFDNGWIDVAVSLDSLLLGAIIVDYYLSNHKASNKNKPT
ncbi:hypothetical protein ES705_38932 [subsurface metagenome]